ncbi:MAG: hypothetical protein AB2L24_04300 [Mangrovibacterium sp.]
MMRHIVTILLICGLIVLCMFRPFMPGRYDNLSVPLSFMTQIFSFSSLLLVPLGLIWIVLKRLTSNREVINRRFANVTLLIFGLLSLIVSIGPFSQNNASFAILFLATTFFVLTKLFLKFKKGNISEILKSHPIPIYLTIIPVIITVVRIVFIGTAVEFSRDTAIKNSEPLIQAIENYYDRNGYYPISLQALHPDIQPEVIGISQYHYEPNGDAYNLYFKQFSDELDVDEIVMFNKLNEHYFTSHSMDILEYSGEDLVLRRGDRRRFNLSTPNWIYIKFE